MNDQTQAPKATQTAEPVAMPAQQIPGAAPLPAKVQATAQTEWDAFQIMDSLDEEAIRKELEGIASDELVYSIKEGDKETTGLSKAGVDECCRILAEEQRQPIREETLTYQREGTGEDEVAFFQVVAARILVAPNGAEVKLDTALGVKRQPLYAQSQPLSMNSRIPAGGKSQWRGKTWAEVFAAGREGVGYIEWISNAFREDDIREFAKAILAGNAVDREGGKKFNPFWYEHGAMKAARNARFRLIPALVRARVMKAAMDAGKVRTVAKDGDARPGNGGSSSPSPRDAQGGPRTATANQLTYLGKLIGSSAFSEEERAQIKDWLATGPNYDAVSRAIDHAKQKVEKSRRARGEDAGPEEGDGGDGSHGPNA